ncbi:MAG: hypothetical protein H6816_00010 [Phycisphaerales bacterium]|nr:hypothetical protein [Phycisphaerales bacterium]
MEAKNERRQGRAMLVVSTVGTSTLTGGIDNAGRSLLTKHANATEVPADVAAAVVAQKEAAVGRLGDLTGARRQSAEINGLAAVLDGREAGWVAHLLVHTDTYQGRIACGLVEDAIGALFSAESVSPITEAGLRTDEAVGFRWAVTDLVAKLTDAVEGYRARGYEIVFNLTGGFKSLNGFLQALGTLYADRCVYLFEGSQALMTIPRLPVVLDPAAALRPHRDVFRRLGMGVAVDAGALAAVPETLVQRIDDEAAPSVWGTALWEAARPDLLGAELLPPLTERIRFGHGFVKDVAGLKEAGRVAQVNRQLDALAAQLEGARAQLKSETFKKLKGDPAPPCTHELYLWSDRDAARALGYFDGGVFVVDRLVPHLR